MPEKATNYNAFPPAYVCQMFRGNHPVSTDLLFACMDPEKNKVNLTSAGPALRPFSSSSTHTHC